MTTGRRLRTLHTAGALATGLVVGAAGVANAAVPAPTSIAPVSVHHGTTGAGPHVTGLRTGRQANYDRLVINLRGAMPSYRVRYVPAVVQDGSGAKVPLRGTAYLAIQLDAVAHTAAGTGTITTARTLTPLHPALRQVKFVSDFEGVVGIGAGLAFRAGFRVSELTSPTRLVVDVAHTPAYSSTAIRLPRSGADAQLVAMHAASHPGYDRLVFQFDHGLPAAYIRYVPRVYHDASGAPVSLLGSAFVEITFHGAATYDVHGRTVFTGSSVLTPRLRSLRQVKITGDYERVLSAGAGLRARVPFRVLELSGPPRVVIDFRH